TLDDRALLHHERRRVELGEDAPAGVHLDALLREDDAAHGARNGEPPHPDLAVDDSGFPHDELLVRHHVALQRAVDAAHVLEPQMPLEARAAIKETIEAAGLTCHSLFTSLSKSPISSSSE